MKEHNHVKALRALVEAQSFLLERRDEEIKLLRKKLKALTRKRSKL